MAHIASYVCEWLFYYWTTWAERVFTLLDARNFFKANETKRLEKLACSLWLSVNKIGFVVIIARCLIMVGGDGGGASAQNFSIH